MNMTALPHEVYMMDPVPSNFHMVNQQHQQAVQHQPSSSFSAATSSRLSFPEKLHALLSDSEKCGFQDVVSWQGSGESFKVHKPNEFTKIIPTYFNKPIKFTSFQRQLSIYGFQRIRTGWNTGGYSHPFFIRTSPEICKMVKRHCKPTASGQCISSAPPLETTRPVEHPVMDNLNFNLSESFFDEHHHIATQKTMDEKMDHAFHADLEPIPLASAAAAPVKQATMPEKMSSLGSLFGSGVGDDHHIIEKLNTCFLQEDIFNSSKMNASWNMMAPEEPPENPDASKSAFFPSKLHHLLEDAEKLNFEHIVSWTDKGRAFQIHDQKEFVDKIMNIYFDQSKFASFRRQLNLYGFCRRRSTSNTGNEYFHENFIQANPALCHKMLRKCATKNV